MSNEPRIVFVCRQRRPRNHPQPGCSVFGSAQLLLALQRAQQRHNGYAQVRITYSGCFDQCNDGPNVMVFPEGTLYRGVRAEDVEEIYIDHLIGGKPVERLATRLRTAVKPTVK